MAIEIKIATVEDLVKVLTAARKAGCMSIKIGELEAALYPEPPAEEEMERFDDSPKIPQWLRPTEVA